MAEEPAKISKFRSLGLIVIGSIALGLVLAAFLVVVPFAGARENAISGTILLAFALGWALIRHAVNALHGSTPASPEDEAKAMSRGDELQTLLNDRIGQLLRGEVVANQ